MSGYRGPNETGSVYDAQGKSSHSYGLAADIDGLDGPNGTITKRWAQIAQQNGISNPYGVTNPREFNHWQLPTQPLETTPDLLGKLKAASVSGNPQDMWNAYGGATPATGGGGGTRIGVLPELNTAIEAAAAKNGISPDYLRAIAMIESNGGRSLSSALSSAKGPFQFTSGTAARMGLANPMDFGQSADAAARLAKENKGGLERLLGRPVTDAELYLAHQQGSGGAHALLGNPDRLARDLLGPAAVANNIPKGSGYSADTITAKQFADIWLQKYAQAGGGGGGATPPSGGGGTPPASAGDTATPRFVPQTPEQRFESSIAQSLASLSSGGGGKTPGIASEGQAVSDPLDQPAIRMPGLAAAQAPLGPDAVPAQFASGLGGQLADISMKPTLVDPEAVPANLQSLTQGAPGMTALLGTMGTPSAFNYTDPRAAQPIPNTSAGATRGVRFA
jgi:hypothetical protein